MNIEMPVHEDKPLPAARDGWPGRVLRRDEGRRMSRAFDFAEAKRTAPMPEGVRRAAMGTGLSGSLNERGAYLPPFQAIFAELEKPE
jgi:hypothetical protein